MNMVKAFIKQASYSIHLFWPFCLPLHDVTGFRVPSWKQRTDVTDPDTANPLLLDSLASRTMRKQFLLFINYPLSDLLL